MITDKVLELFRERSQTELREVISPSRITWGNVVPTLCDEIKALREALGAIKAINDIRPHDSNGNEINDIILDAIGEKTKVQNRNSNEKEQDKTNKAGHANTGASAD